MVDVVKSNDASELLSNTICVPYEERPIVDAIVTIDPLPATVTVNGKNIPDIFCQVREDGDRMIYAFINISRNNYDNVKLCLNRAGYVTEWDCRNGKVYELDSCTSDDGNISTVNTDFAELQEHLYVVSKNKITGALPYTYETNEEGKPLQLTELEYELNEENVLPLDYAYLTIDGKLQSPKPIEILKLDRQVRKHFGLKTRGGAMLQPWFFAKYKGDTKPTYGTIELKFPFEIESMPESDPYLCIETPDKFEICVNGMPLTTTPSGWWIDPCYKRILLSRELLKKGKNDIGLKVDFVEDINFETMYIVGDFGVDVTLSALQEVSNVIPGVNTNADGILASNPKISKLPATITLGDITSQGLPFYSGEISYKIGNIEKGKLLVNDYVGALVKLRKGDKSEIIAYAPFTGQIPESDEDLWIDVSLTRRNTFGPLHQLPARTWAYAPEMFVTEGDAFSDNYVLFKSGLMSTPILMEK